MSPRHIPPGRERLWQRQAEVDAEYERVSRELDAADRRARRLYDELGEDTITEAADEDVARLSDELNRIVEVANRVYQERLAGLSGWIDHDPTAPICGTCQGTGGPPGHDAHGACPDCRGWGREYREPISVWNESAQAWIDPATGQEVDLLGDGSDRIERPTSPPVQLPPTAAPDIPDPKEGDMARTLREGDNLPLDLPLGGDCPATATRNLPGYGQYQHQCMGDPGHKGDHYAAADTNSGREYIAAVWNDEEAARDFSEQAQQEARDHDETERDRRRVFGEEEPRPKPEVTASEHQAAMQAWLAAGGSLTQFDRDWARYMDGTGPKPTADRADPPRSHKPPPPTGGGGSGGTGMSSIGDARGAIMQAVERGGEALGAGQQAVASAEAMQAAFLAAAAESNQSEADEGAAQVARAIEKFNEGVQMISTAQQSMETVAQRL